MEKVNEGERRGRGKSEAKTRCGKTRETDKRVRRKGMKEEEEEGKKSVK